MIFWVIQAPIMPPFPFPDPISAMEKNNITFYFSGTDIFEIMFPSTWASQEVGRDYYLFRGETRGSERLREFPKVTELIRGITGTSAAVCLCLALKASPLHSSFEGLSSGAGKNITGPPWGFLAIPHTWETVTATSLLMLNKMQTSDKS